MGSFFETDFITREPVFPGDKVVMTVLTDANHVLVPAMFPYPHHDVELIAVGRYNDYGWVEGVDGAWSDGMKLRKAGKKEPYERAIFTLQVNWNALKKWSRSAYERVVEWGKATQATPHVKDKPTQEHIERLAEFNSVLAFCLEARIDPRAGLCFKGSQHTGDRAHRKLCQLVHRAKFRIDRHKD